ncbi:hypothetical protein AURDEDRAFT_64485, partial [Auricularia subglabra TFB-10046 SS5]
MDALLGGPAPGPAAAVDGPAPLHESADPSPPPSPAPESVGNEGPFVDTHSAAGSEGSARTSEPAGYVVERFPEPVATILNTEPQPLPFETRRREQQARGETPYAPFADADEWEFAHWIAKSGLSHGEIDKLLKLRKTQGMNVSFKNSREYFKRIDSLPRGREWMLKRLKLRGDLLDAQGKPLIEKLELWFRNPVEIISDLLANPAFADRIDFEPVRVWLDELKTKRVYGEANTGNWWWELQKRLPPGALIIPVIIASDKTQLSTFSGDKSAYPVYITIGNIHSDIRRQPSSRATILLGYLPVSKFEVYATAETRSAVAHRLFHACMAEMLAPLVRAGTDGINVLCNDGNVRRAYMVLMSYVADYPEQCLVACGQQNQCPSCFVPPKERGSAPQAWPPRTESAILEVLEQGPSHPNYKEYGLKDVPEPFWASLPHSDIFRTFTPDMLHELHKGVFGDHVLKWCLSVLGADEFDHRLKCLPRHPSLRHFNRGIGVISQWRGAEYCEIEKVFVGLTAGHAKPVLGMVARALVDFIYCARMPVHDDNTLAFMEGALSRFHEHKHVFVDLGIRKHFNISKIHKLLHYVPQIRAYGAAPGYNTESPERLHIDLCKEAYRASNRRDFIAQMTVWLSHKEAVDEQAAYIDYCFPPPLLCPSSTDSDSDFEDEDD